MTNKTVLVKGVKYLTGSLPLLFLGPAIIHSSFKNKSHDYYEIVLGGGIFLCLAAIFLIFLGIRIVLKGIFND